MNREELQKIFDDAESRLSWGKRGETCYPEIFLHGVDQICEAVKGIANAMQLPSAIYRPTLSIDGNQWCALYGASLMEGIAGFGDTPELAMRDFDNQFRTAKVPRSAT